MRQLSLRFRDHSFTVTAGSRLVTYDEGELLLPVPFLAIDGDLWLPMIFFTEVLGPASGEAVFWDPEARQLFLGSARHNITRLRIQDLTRATAIHLLCEEPLSFRADASRPGYVILKIYNGQVDAKTVSSGQRGLVEQISSRQYPDYAMVYVQVDDLVDRFRTYTRQDGQEIVLVVEEEQVAALPEPSPRGRANVKLDDGLVDVTRTIDVKTVVIDAGHGGVETGKVGTGGTLEKDVNLAVARELKRYLEDKSDLQVVLTRDKDEQLGLAERAERANLAEGDLFISLHCNGWFNQAASGIETYFLSPAKTDWSRSVAEEENRNDNESPANDDISFIVWELVQNRYISASSDLAEVVQSSLCQELSASDRGVKQAGFRVLIGAYMPAVLVEMGFLSNPADEENLRSQGYQRRMARHLGDALLEFKDRYARSAFLAGEGEE
ncbi:MAG: N-acetylmuramoyl-L-alanine amidase [bacterium]